MKKVLTILILGLAILAFNGCGESEELKEGRLQFLSNSADKNFGKAKAQKIAEAKYGEKVVKVWVNELRNKGEWIKYEEGKADFWNRLSLMIGGDNFPDKEDERVISIYKDHYGDVVDEWITEMSKELKGAGGRINYLE